MKCNIQRSAFHFKLQLNERNEKPTIHITYKQSATVNLATHDEIFERLYDDRFVFLKYKEMSILFKSLNSSSHRFFLFSILRTGTRRCEQFNKIKTKWNMFAHFHRRKYRTTKRFRQPSHWSRSMLRCMYIVLYIWFEFRVCWNGRIVGRQQWYNWISDMFGHLSNHHVFELIIMCHATPNQYETLEKSYRLHDFRHRVPFSLVFLWFPHYLLFSSGLCSHISITWKIVLFLVHQLYGFSTWHRGWKKTIPSLGFQKTLILPIWFCLCFASFWWYRGGWTQFVSHFTNTALKPNYVDP